MKLSRMTLRFAALASMLLVTSVTWAAEEGGSSASQGPITAFKWIHFVILAGLAYWLFTKILPPAFRHKADSISAAIAKATVAKADADKQLKEATVKLASLEQEVEHFRTQAQAEAAAEVQRLQAMTKTDVEKINLAAIAEIEAAERAARVELKTLAAKLAVNGAESLVSKELTPALQEAMINQFVQSLQGRPN